MHLEKEDNNTRYHSLAAVSEDIKGIKSNDLWRGERDIVRGATKWSD